MGTEALFQTTVQVRVRPPHCAQLHHHEPLHEAHAGRGKRVCEPLWVQEGVGVRLGACIFGGGEEKPCVHNSLIESAGCRSADSGFVARDPRVLPKDHALKEALGPHLQQLLAFDVPAPVAGKHLGYPGVFMPAVKVRRLRCAHGPEKAEEAPRAVW